MENGMKKMIALALTTLATTSLVGTTLTKSKP
jgi:hypothetical protein